MASIVVVYGTRPEAIKLAPVIRTLLDDPEINTTVVATGQHTDLLAPVHATFGIVPDTVLNVAQPGQRLSALAARTIDAVSDVIERIRPDIVVVHGDTTAAAATAIAAHYAGTRIAHVEAGLRSGDLQSPFPEEANRRIIGQLADINFAPTEAAAANLLAENVPLDRIHVTGNTVIDALLHTVGTATVQLDERVERAAAAGTRIVLFTGHRRESWEHGLATTAQGIADAIAHRDDVLLFAPLHPNPIVRSNVEPAFRDHPNAIITEPLDYPAFCRAMQLAHCIVSDSGGVQEEAPSLGTPVLVTRTTTERPEALTAGATRLVGTGRADVARELTTLLDDPTAHAAMHVSSSPYGDGHAAERIRAVLRTALALSGVQPDLVR